MLKLRSLAQSDDAFILTLLTDPAWLRFIGDRGVSDLSTAQVFISQKRPLRLYDYPCFQVIEHQNKAIGLCTFLQRDYLALPDIGYALLPCARGQGLATQAAKQLIADCREKLGLQQLAALTAINNAASIKLLEGLDFKPLGPIQTQGQESLLLIQD